MDLRFDSALAADVCFAISRKLSLRRDRSSAGSTTQTFSDEEYAAWRAEELEGQFDGYFSGDMVRGKDVVDFGCGSGDLAFHITKFHPKTVLGLELDPEGVEIANRRLEKESFPVTPEFRVNPTPNEVNLPSDSCDLILCFDVLEHVMDIEAILAEWKRVLRPGGKVGIWWCPWFHPYGPHIEALVPIPWCHVVFSDRVLIETCARIYDMPEYEPRVWDFEEDGSRKKNKWLSMDELPEVNQLTMADFEALCPRFGIRVTRRQVVGFGGSTISRLSRPLTRLPVLREFFASFVIYELSV